VPDQASAVSFRTEFGVLDVIYVAAAIGLFALIALVARGVEKL
jgi:hypothetical protein